MNATEDITRDRMLERPLPHSADAERAILGAIVLNNTLAGQAVELLRPEDFYIRAHQFIFRAMDGLRERGIEIDPVLLGEELRREGALEQVGGIAFISELTSGLPRLSNVAAYAKVVKEHSLMRQIAKAANKITSEALEGDDGPRAALDRARELISALGDEVSRSDGGARSSLVPSFADFMRVRFDDGEEIAFHARRGEVALVQSVTNHGKSTLIRNAVLALTTGAAFPPVVEAGEARRVLLLNFEGSGGWFQTDIAVMTRDFSSSEIELTSANLHPNHAPMLHGEPLSLSRHVRALEADGCATRRGR